MSLDITIIKFGYQLVSNILFNDESEHQFQIQCHVLGLTQTGVEALASEKEEWIKNKFKGAFHMDDSFVDWSSVKEIANRFPEAQ